MAETRRPGSRYRRVDGLTLKLSRRVPGCENEMWFADVMDGSQPAGGPGVVVTGSSLDSERWTKL